MGSKKDELIAKYTAHLREKLQVEPDAELLERVVHALGPAIYNRDAATVSSSSSSELETVKQNFLIKKLGLDDSPLLMDTILDIMEKYGTSERTKYRAVVYYMLVNSFNKQEIYN
ncbi:MAG: DUF2853 family protein [Flavobacteriaceae bacterium]